MDNMVRFGLDEFVDVPAGKPPFTRAMPGTSAFLAFIWLVNREKPKYFDEVHLVVDGPYTREQYCDETGVYAEVIMGNGSREQRENEGFRIVTHDPEMLPIWDKVGRWIYQHSYLGIVEPDGRVRRDEHGIPVHRFPVLANKS